MIFPVKANKFSGLLRRFKNTGYPKIELFPSSTANDFIASYVLDFNRENLHWASTGQQGFDEQFVVKIDSGVLKITNYSIRSHPDSCYMRKWTLEGSNDDNNYAMLDDRPENDDLNKSGVGQYPADPHNNYYQYFRIKQTMKNNCDDRMRLSTLDFYGNFLPFQCKTFKLMKEQRKFLLCIINILLSA